MQKARQNSDWNSFIFYNIHFDTKDLKDKALLGFFLNKLYEDGIKIFPFQIK